MQVGGGCFGGRGTQAGKNLFLGGVKNPKPYRLEGNPGGHAHRELRCGPEGLGWVRITQTSPLTPPPTRTHAHTQSELEFATAEVERAQARLAMLEREKEVRPPAPPPPPPPPRPRPRPRPADGGLHRMGRPRGVGSSSTSLCPPLPLRCMCCFPRRHCWPRCRRQQRRRPPPRPRPAASALREGAQPRRSRCARSCTHRGTWRRVCRCAPARTSRLAPAGAPSQLPHARARAPTCRRSRWSRSVRSWRARLRPRARGARCPTWGQGAGAPPGARGRRSHLGPGAGGLHLLLQAPTAAAPPRRWRRLSAPRSCPAACEASPFLQTNAPPGSGTRA